jgi:signal transduction histidine kinase
VNIYRIFQESLTNIGRHAGATQITVKVQNQGDRVSFMVQDNGQGFDVEQVLGRQSMEWGVGLAAMQERVRLEGGEMNIWSRPGQGTRISFTIPVRPPGG